VNGVLIYPNLIVAAVFLLVSVSAFWLAQPASNKP
jgi:hypothetical protein